VIVSGLVARIVPLPLAIEMWNEPDDAVEPATISEP
jgi:hypothetical protein